MMLNEKNLVANGFAKVNVYAPVYGGIRVWEVGHHRPAYDDEGKVRFRVITALPKVRYINRDEIAQIYTKDFAVKNDKLFDNENVTMSQYYQMPNGSCKNIDFALEKNLVKMNQFAVIVLKHGISTNLGLNGTDHEDTLIVDIKDINAMFK